ncbi:MAG: D-serine ammonia-lyase [Firmicutes bacterium]|nr:D-serine ammonia-lyase [Bacillota bacterium]
MDLYTRSILNDVINLRQVNWINKRIDNFDEIKDNFDIKYEDIIDAKNRLDRFAPLIKKMFPETNDGIIESPLVKTDTLKYNLEEQHKRKIKGELFLKCDNYLKVAGSIKARGGIYEVLKHAEEIAIEKGLLNINDNYSKLSNKEFKKLFSQYKIAVGSTGNLGLSIGIISAALGFNVDVHMSRDAKEWKKKLLRKKGANVIEYKEDYNKAVKEGRRQCDLNENCYFIDDENSLDLFLGYSVAAIRLKDQLDQEKVFIDEDNPLYVYLPCGVGGAPGGIAFGLKHVFGDNVKCYFVEPTHSPCMLMGILTEKYDKVNVNDFNIDNITEADGLAVASPSKLVSHMAKYLVNGIYTIEDFQLFKYLTLLKLSEDIKVEPSAASSILGPAFLDFNKKGVHISWLTGGLFLPDDIYEKMYSKGKELI